MFNDVYALKSFIDQIISDSNCSDDFYVNVIQYSDINAGTQRVVLYRDIFDFLDETNNDTSPEETLDTEINDANNVQREENRIIANKFNLKYMTKLINMDSAVIEIYDMHSGRAMWVVYNKKQIRITALHNERSDRICSQELMIKAMAINSGIDVHKSSIILDNMTEFNAENFRSSILYMVILRSL